MLKVLGSIIIIGATTVIGFCYANAYTERVRQLRDMQYALNMLESEIIFTSTPLIMALQNAGNKSSDVIRKMFIKMSGLLKDKKVESVADAFKESLTSVRTELYFEKEEIDIIMSFVQSLGISDMEAQKKNFNITIKKLESFEQKAEETRKKNERLYKYLGVSCGILIVIILV